MESDLLQRLERASNIDMIREALELIRDLTAERDDYRAALLRISKIQPNRDPREQVNESDDVPLLANAIDIARAASDKWRASGATTPADGGAA